MRTFLSLILTGLLAINVSGQVLFSPIDSKLKTQKIKGLTELICATLQENVRFQVKRNVTVLQPNNFATVDSQTIQVIPLQYSGFKKNTNAHSLSDQKQLLDTYSKYELSYFENELGIEIIDSNSQWVVIKSKGWFIWYFRVGNLPINVKKQSTIQLFASTVIGDKILTLNAPLGADSDFTKAGLIINEMMETMIVGIQ